MKIAPNLYEQIVLHKYYSQKKYRTTGFTAVLEILRCFTLRLCCAFAYLLGAINTSFMIEFNLIFCTYICYTFSDTN